MSRRVIVRPLAESDLADAAAWYERERAGLAEKFLDDLNRTLSGIRERPLHFPVVWRELHRALLHTFPYAIYFRAAKDVVTVLAVLHQRRDPKVPSARSGRSRLAHWPRLLANGHCHPAFTRLHCPA